MEYEYNKKHVQASVVAASALGTLLGFWLGSRAGTAGILEGIGVFVFLVFAATVVFSRIDEKLLPPKPERNED